MEPVFTLPYPEFAVANELQRYFKPKKGYSVLIPLSRQQKGFDLILYNKKSSKTITVQIKNSRVWPNKPPRRKVKKQRLQFGSWFNIFKYQRDMADYYIFFMLYPKENMKNLSHGRETKKWYDSKLLIFNDKEMRKFLNKLEDKKYFGFSFNSNSKKILLSRGLKNKYPSYKNNLLENKIDEIKKEMK